MKTTKAKTTRRRGTKNASRRIVVRTPRQKAALRSSAFTRAVLNAQSYVEDNSRLESLVVQASEKLASIPKEPLRESWPYLQTMLRLTKAYSRGEYRAVSRDAFVSIVAALSYLIDPFDLIPDEVPFLGLIDDATVIASAIHSSRDDLDDFMTWETAAS